VTLTNVVINDPLTGSVDLTVTPSTLAPNQTGTATATYTTTQADVNDGQVLNTATATGEDPGGDTVEDTDDETIQGPKQEPDITLVKTANPQTYSSVGQTITYTFSVTNTGNVTLTNVVINDPLTESVDLAVSPSTLQPNQTGTVTATYTITQADIDAGQVLNTATATGEDPNDNPVEDTDDETINAVLDPKISLVKTADPQSYENTGETITYNFTVTNTGNVTLTDVVINDPLTGSVDLAVTPSTLAPTEVGTATATYTTTQADIDAGQILNTATATGKDPDGDPVYDTDDETIDGPERLPAITLVKSADPITYVSAGDVITYTFTVTNSGNVTLTDVVIDDPLTGSVDLAVTPSTLTPAEIGTATATYTITQTDIHNGQVLNTATATGKDPDGDP
jgi:trimeric autotransporter adhesin